ncbi:GNAT family N-acetyltransferase [Saccharopolyspora erythraea]|uniref:GNAT family N-acetyltransferase n=1 Tax=Saccharopolyspora erythraea TaxID=1836 RepID=UPI001BAD599D|nr:GNAT family N-acetyltransferase [Saccharopolyspora erythraea]QUH01775.1 GNAT family N-acetyltransferase [Saccharopolyspora erythraea]
MDDLDVRPLAESEHRRARSLFMRSLHRPDVDDQQWERVAGRYEPGRVLGSFDEGELAGTAISLASSIAVPGGGVLPAAAVTGVGVRADRTRRGALRSLMRRQLADARESGEPLAMLHASEAVIYERFGYGVATRSRTVSLDRFRSVLRPEAPVGGRVRMVDADTAAKLLPEIYRNIGLRRTGMISRSDGWWTSWLAALRESTVAAVHSDDDGVDDGFVLYEAKANDYRFDDGAITLQVLDIQGADPAVVAGLWGFLLGLDLADRIVAIRPVDELLEWWLTDRRQCRVTSVDDDLWLRLVDVPAALSARTYGKADPVVVEVRDAFLPDNSGHYRIEPGEVRRCGDSPQLSLGVDALASLYLGDVAVSDLVAAGRVAVHDPSAVAAADRLFATAETPWCGTSF